MAPPDVNSAVLGRGSRDPVVSGVAGGLGTDDVAICCQVSVQFLSGHLLC